MSGKPDKAPEATPDKPAAPAAPKVAVKGQALPDAALMDNDGEATAAPVPARQGLAAWLPHTRRGWSIAGASAFSLTLIAAATVFSLYRLQAPELLASFTVTGPAIAVDGATVNVAGQKLQLDGIEAPPAGLICRDRAWKYRCGDDARRALETAIGRGGLECVANLAGEATCRNDQGMDVAALQVENGWAVVDLRQTSRYFVEQARAQQDSRGLWRNDFAQPESWRLAQSDEKSGLSGLNRRP